MAEILDHAKIVGRTLYLDLWYPNIGERVNAIQIGLMHTRAADEIRVSYDFDRDGWKIEQASVFEWDGDDDICDRGWKEVAFVQAWGSQTIPPRDEG